MGGTLARIERTKRAAALHRGRSSDLRFSGKGRSVCFIGKVGRASRNLNWAM